MCTGKNPICPKDIPGWLCGSPIWLTEVEPVAVWKSHVIYTKQGAGYGCVEFTLDLPGWSLWLCGSVASKISLKSALPTALATSSCAVPKLSIAVDWVLEMWTPRSRWMPQHSKHTNTPRFVDNHSGSRGEKNHDKKNVGWKSQRRTKISFMKIIFSPIRIMLHPSDQIYLPLTES